MRIDSKMIQRDILEEPNCPLDRTLGWSRRDQLSLDARTRSPRQTAGNHARSSSRRLSKGQFDSLKNRRGFTLVEVLISVFVLAVAVAGTLLAFTKTNQMMTQLRELTVAEQCVKEEIESIRDMSYTAILGMGSTFTAAGFSSLNNAAGTLTIDDPFGDPDIRRVTVTVAWDSNQGRQLSIQQATLVTREGINKQ